MSKQQIKVAKPVWQKWKGGERGDSGYILKEQFRDLLVDWRSDVKQRSNKNVLEDFNLSNQKNGTAIDCVRNTVGGAGLGGEKLRIWFGGLPSWRSG